MASEVKRWDFEAGDGIPPQAMIFVDGEWVLHSDYEALREVAVRLAKELEPFVECEPADKCEVCGRAYAALAAAREKGLI